MAKQTISTDPITRIEGHLKIEVDVEDGYIFIDDKTFYIADEYISVE